MKPYGGHSMVGSLLRVVVCTPGAAGWAEPERSEGWRELGYFHPPEPELAEKQHRALTRRLEEVGAEIVSLPAAAALSLDGVYVHDASLMTDHGALLMRMGKRERRGEPPQHGKLYESLGIPVLGAIEPPGTAEGGDIVWLDETTLLVGRGYRTNAAGIGQIRALLAPKGVEVLEAHLPHGAGAGACLHLMSLMSLLDERTVLVDLAWLSVPTVELLEQRAFRLIEIDPTERKTMAVNVLSAGQGRLIALEENHKTNERLREHGFEVTTFKGSELCQNGSGGPTCLTRPIWREP